MPYVSTSLTFINAVFINIALIISAILTFYFANLKAMTSRKKSKLSFISEKKQKKAPLAALLLGITLGYTSFILSLNRIPLENFTRTGVDMRYVIIYFAVCYGSTPIGLIAALVLILLKAISYQTLVQTTASEMINNIIFTLIVLALAIVLNKHDAPILKKNSIFLLFFFSIRFLSFNWYFPNFLIPKNLLAFGKYMLIFSFVFSLAALIINLAITVSKSVHVYRQAAIFDTLTNVYNKESFHFFLDYLATENKQSQSQLSLAVIDIDNFKQINDTFGHLAGDATLVYIAQSLKNTMPRSNTYICRIGGDEFALLTNQPFEVTEYAFLTLIEKLSKEPFIYEQKAIGVTLSVGLAHFRQLNDFDSEHALDIADAALYRAKENGKNQLYITKKDDL